MKSLFLATVAIVALSPAANATVVTNSNLDGWAPANVRTDATVGITSTYAPAGETGSLQFTTNTVTNGQDKADFTKYWGVVAGRTLGNLSEVGFDFYRNASSTTAAHLAPAFRLAYQTADGKFGYLVYESVYNGYPTTGAGVPTNAWVDNDILAANFWMRAFGPGRTIEQFDVKLDDWAAGNTYGTSDKLGRDTNIVGIEIGVGSGWGGTFDGAVDDVRLGFGADRITANFEANADAVPEPATWGMMVLGFGLAGAAVRRRRATTVLA